ncbi:MAG: hypothetical protein ACYC3L_12565 [Gemmatimonadaceae bacterium]
MEMTPGRLAALTLGAFVLMAVAKPPRPTGGGYGMANPADRPSALTKRALSAASDSLLQTRSLLRLDATRDSVRQKVLSLPAAARNQVIADPRIKPSLRALWQQTYAASLASMGPGVVALPLVVVIDTTGWTYSSVQWLDTSSPESPSCATVVRLTMSPRVAADARELNFAVVHNRLAANFPQPADLGLCAFVARYGAPSPQMRAWLRDRDWRAVVTGYSPALPVRNTTAQMDFLYDLFWSSYDNSALGLHRRACRAGNDRYCLDAVAPRSLHRVKVDDGYVGFRYGSVAASDLMNQLAVSMGPAKFEELWRASDPLPVAYLRITGVPVDTLARRLIVGRGDPMRAGATVTAPEALVVLMITLLLAGVSTLAHPRRRKR